MYNDSGVTSHRLSRQCWGPRGPKRQWGPKLPELCIKTVIRLCTGISQNPDNHASTPPLRFFLQTGCHSCRPTNSVKALKADASYCDYCSETRKNCCRRRIWLRPQRPAALAQSSACGRDNAVGLTSILDREQLSAYVLSLFHISHSRQTSYLNVYGTYLHRIMYQHCY